MLRHASAILLVGLIAHPVSSFKRRRAFGCGIQSTHGASTTDHSQIESLKGPFRTGPEVKLVGRGWSC